MRVVFITSAYRTPVFHAVGQLLERFGHEIFWISPNNRWARWLVRHGQPPERLLDMTRFAGEWRKRGSPTPDDYAELGRAEAGAGWNVYDLAQMDPLLRRRPWPYALRYLAACARHVRHFLVENRIDALSSETTWAVELVANLVCDELGIPLLRPLGIRYPDNRWAFFGSRYETAIVRSREPTSEDRLEAEKDLQTFREKEAAAYMNFTSLLILQARWSRIKTLIRHVWDLAWDPYDETSLGPLGLIGRWTAMYLREWRNRRLSWFERAELPPKRPFVYFPLHLEPEMSIDVMGNPFCNQIELIRAMARTLPLTHDLWVKEHRVALSKRSKSFYRQLRQVPGVRLIDPFESSLAILKQADLTVSVTGTACYEAALLGRPSVLMRPTLFSDAVLTDRFNPFTDSLKELLGRVRPDPEGSRQRLIEFLARLRADSFPGVIGDALYYPECMAPENMARVADGFHVVLQRLAPTDAG